MHMGTAKASCDTTSGGVTMAAITNAMTMKTYDVYCAHDLTNALAFYGAGSKVRVRYQRAGKELTWEGELGAVQGK